MAIGGIERPSTKAATNMKSRAVVIHTIRGGQWAILAGVELNTKTLQAMGRCMVATLKREASKYMARIGWSGEDPMGGPPLWDSFSFRLAGMDVQIRSSFYGMKELAHGSIPSRRMTWLTQEYKDRNPTNFQRSFMDRKLNRSGSDRGPLIVPIKTNGTVEFRMAPLKMSDAWVHPGIAKFTFFETAIRKGRKACIDIVKAKIK
jgi:hypothetical protein